LLTILKEEPNAELNVFMKKQGAEKISSDKIIMAAKDGEKYLGVGALELKDYKAYLNTLVTETDDLILRLAIIKSLLNLADLRGIKTVYGDNPELSSYYKMARFKEADGEYAVDLVGYFDCCE